MDRRSFLRTVPSVMTLIGGCLTSLGDSDTRLPDGVTTEFSILSERPSGSIENAPTISVSHARQVVTVRGKLWRGDSCETVEPDVLEYDTDSRRFTVVIAAVDKDTPIWVTSCQPALGAIEYELTAQFSRPLPRVITATERPTDGFEAQRTAKVLDRQ